MSQTVIGSIAESWVNIAIGFTINYAANLLILPMFGFHSLTPGKNFIIGLLYTVISLVRSFVIRRWFNGLKFGNTPTPQQKVDDFRAGIRGIKR